MTQEQLNKGIELNKKLENLSRKRDAIEKNRANVAILNWVGNGATVFISRHDIGDNDANEVIDNVLDIIQSRIESIKKEIENI